MSDRDAIMLGKMARGIRTRGLTEATTLEMALLLSIVVTMLRDWADAQRAPAIERDRLEAARRRNASTQTLFLFLDALYDKLEEPYDKSA